MAQSTEAHECLVIVCGACNAEELVSLLKELGFVEVTFSKDQAMSKFTGIMLSPVDLNKVHDLVEARCEQVSPLSAVGVAVNTAYGAHFGGSAYVH